MRASKVEVYPAARLMLARDRKYNCKVLTIDARILQSASSDAGRVVLTTRDDTGAVVDRSVQSLEDVVTNGVAITNPLALDVPRK